MGESQRERGMDEIPNTATYDMLEFCGVAAGGTGHPVRMWLCSQRGFPFQASSNASQFMLSFQVTIVQNI